MLDMQTRWDRAKRLIEAATGDEYGNGGPIVMDIGEGVAEPGYSDIAESFWATGDWNPKRFIFEFSDDQTPLTNAESLPVRLGNALVKYAGFELLWYDEWETCGDCRKLIRTTHDSYGWTRYFVDSEYDGRICGDCATWDDIAESVTNDHTRIVPTFIDLEAEGFEQYNKDYDYENGWHPGQDDDPEALMQLAHDEGWDEVAFKMGSVGQFDMRFSMFVRKEQ